MSPKHLPQERHHEVLEIVHDPRGGVGGVLAGAVVDPLASQGALTLDRAHHLLFAVNAGSDTVAVFGVHGSTLVRRQVLPVSGSTRA
ncbi:MAG: hypothetical protein M0Z51_12005 [Propionibacterium sp.]|nr:hypothetical protein [Propionibacterium sp.]